MEWILHKEATEHASSLTSLHSNLCASLLLVVDIDRSEPPPQLSDMLTPDTMLVVHKAFPAPSAHGSHLSLIYLGRLFAAML